MTDIAAGECDCEGERDHGTRDDGLHNDLGTELRLQVPDMDCPSCAETVGSGLDRVSGVIEYDLRPTTGQVSVSLDSQASRESVVTAIETAGYEVIDVVDSDERMDFETDPIWRSPRGIKTGISAFVMVLALIVSFGLPSIDTTVIAVVGHAFSVSDLLFLVAVAVGSEVILSSGYRSLRTLSLDMGF